MIYLLRHETSIQYNRKTSWNNTISNNFLYSYITIVAFQVYYIKLVFIVALMK